MPYLAIYFSNRFTGTHFNIEAVEAKAEQERMGSDTADTAKAYYNGGADTHFYVNAFYSTGRRFQAACPGFMRASHPVLTLRMLTLFPAVENACG
ncbi:hypothetical protein AB8A28_21400 [Tardiphaga sp. 71_E8_N1_1]|uniref:hypothetical protein n=1 Tax=Tardiphaga sp. 71_E8_N1_1 TaxID=3240784 RepID=UPI003F8B7500